jgi:hypothetical protein
MYRVFFFLLDRQAPVRRSSELLLYFLKFASLPSFVWLLSSPVEHLRHAVYDATLAERREEYWVGNYRSSGEESTEYIMLACAVEG